MHKTLSVVMVLSLLVIGVVGVTYFAGQNKGGLNFATNESTNDIETSNNTSDTALEADLASIQLEDPSKDFTSVDSDINSL